MILEFLSLLLLNQIIGDCILQYDRIFFKRDAERFTLLEQFVFSLILGMLMSGLLTLIVVAFIPFNYYVFLLLNALFIFITIVVNRGRIYGFFYWQIYESIKHKKFDDKTKRYYLKFGAFLIGIILLNLYIRSFIYDIRNIDLLPFADRALSTIRNGLNFNFSNYLFNHKFPFKTYFFSIILIPFYAINPSEWLNIVGVYLSSLQIFLFFILIFILLHIITPKFNIIPVFFITTATVVFLSWFSYFLPTNFTIILFLTFLLFLFNQKIKSLFIGTLLLYFTFIIHPSSTLILYTLPLVLTILLNLRFEPDKLVPSYYKKKEKLISFLKKNKSKMIIGFISLFLILFLFLVINSSFIQDIWNKYIRYSSYNTTLPTPILWRKLTLGFWITLFVLIFFVYLYKRKNSPNKNYLILFFVLFTVYLTIYLLFPELLNDIIRTLYSEFRFIIYLDISLLILIPILLFFIKRDYDLFYRNNFMGVLKRNKKVIREHFIKKKSVFRNLVIRIYLIFKKKNKKYREFINFSNIIYLLTILSLIFYCLLKTIPNYQKRYYHKYFEEFWYDEYSNAFIFLNNIALGYETYMFNQNNPYSHMNAHVSTYMEDVRCVDFNQANFYMNDLKYQTNNSNYQAFQNFVFNESKLIENDENLPIYLKVVKTVDYIIIDSFLNPNLCKLMENDTTHFTKIFEIPIVNSIIILLNSLNPNMHVYIFKTN
ncbi:MAG: membrane protein of unknown function [Promethearchaeota archaeon]|nr:MAG: membrane protein of unknown function [Candidatus Lokiarchaeota archaeon]